MTCETCGNDWILTAILAVVCAIQFWSILQLVRLCNSIDFALHAEKWERAKEVEALVEKLESDNLKMTSKIFDSSQN